MTTCSAGFVGRRARFVSALRALTVAALVLLHWAPAAATSPFDAPLDRLSRNTPATLATMPADFKRGWASPDAAVRLGAARTAAVYALFEFAGLETLQAHLDSAVALARESRDRDTQALLTVIQGFHAAQAQPGLPGTTRRTELIAAAAALAQGSADATLRCLVNYALGLDGRNSVAEAEQMRPFLAALAERDAAPACRSWVVAIINRSNAHRIAPDSRAMLPTALSQIDEALGATPPVSYSSLGGALLLARSTVYERAGQLPQAEPPLKQALALARGIGDRTLEVQALDSMESLYVALDRPRAVLDILKQSEALVDPTSMPDMFTIWVRAAEMHARLSPPEATQALASLKRAEGALASIPDGRYQRRFYEVATDVHERLGDATAALAQNKRLLAVTRDQIRQGHADALAALQVKFDVEKRKLEAERLQDSVNALTERRNLLMGGLALAAVAALALGWLLRNQVRQKRHVASLYGQLEKLNQKRAQFLASAYHDLRQPAHSLSLLAEVAATAPAASPRVVDDIRRLTVVMSDMLTSLLDMNQLERGEMTVTPGPVSLDALFDEAARQFQPDAQRKRLSLTVQPGGLWVRSDPQVLRRIVFNLVSNACKYTDRGSVRLTATQRDGDRVEIEVSDTGRGMPPERIPDMLRPYTRMDHGTSETGLGIGLSVVQRATALLGHTLGIDSAPGQGTRVRITLAASEPVLADTVAPQPADTLDGAVVAVIDDSAEVRAALQLLLEQWNAQVVQAASSADVARSLAEGAFGPGGMPDLLVVDHDMGDETGFDAIERLRARQGWEQMPAVMVTGSVSPDIEQRSRALGVPLVLKPARPAQMRRVLHALLSRRREAADAMAA